METFTKTAEKDLHTANINGVIYTNIYTNENWEHDRVILLKEGWIIDPKVFHQLLNGVPPRTFKGRVFQPGENCAYDWETGKDLYLTFESVGNDYYKYVGLKPAQ